MVETKDLLGYRVGRVLDKIGQNGWDTAEFFLDDCRVPVANLLGPAWTWSTAMKLAPASLP